MFYRGRGVTCVILKITGHFPRALVYGRKFKEDHSAAGPEAVSWYEFFALQPLYEGVD